MSTCTSPATTGVFGEYFSCDHLKTNVLVWHMHQRLGVARAPRVTSRCFLFSHVQDKHPNTSDTRQEKRRKHDACRCDGFRRRSQAPTLHSIRTPRSRTTTTTKSEPTIYDSPAAAGWSSAELSRRFNLNRKWGRPHAQNARSLCFDVHVLLHV